MHMLLENIHEFILMQTELLWANCGLELVNAKQAIKDLQLYFAKQESTHRNEIILKSRLPAKTNIQKALEVLDPRVKKKIITCLRKINLLFLEYGEESSSKNWHMEYVDSMFTRSNVPRRRDLVQSSAQAPTPFPAVAAPTFSPTPSSSKAHYPKSSRSASESSPADLNDASSNEPSALSSSNLESNNQNVNRKTVVVAVLVTAVVTFSVVTLFFLFYFKVCGTRPTSSQKAESPLLCLSLSNYSIGTCNFYYHTIHVKSLNDLLII